MTRDPRIRWLVGLCWFASALGCSCPDCEDDACDGGMLDGSLDADPSFDATFVDAGDAAHDADASAPRDGEVPDATLDPARDGGSDAGGGPSVQLGPRCQDEEWPGFRRRADGTYDICNCYDRDEDGVLRPVPTFSRNGLVRGVRFDCSWPEGALFAFSGGPQRTVAVEPTACDPIVNLTGLLATGFVAEPYAEVVVFTHGHPPDIYDSACFPAECVFDTPGEVARCSEACAPATAQGWVTVYRVDRTACAEESAWPI